MWGGRGGGGGTDSRCGCGSLLMSSGAGVAAGARSSMALARTWVVEQRAARRQGSVGNFILGVGGSRVSYTVGVCMSPSCVCMYKVAAGVDSKQRRVSVLYYSQRRRVLGGL